MGVSINGDTPIAGWFIRENPSEKLMITRGTPISGNLHLSDFSVVLQLDKFEMSRTVWVL